MPGRHIPVTEIDLEDCWNSVDVSKHPDGAAFAKVTGVEIVGLSKIRFLYDEENCS